MKNTRDVAVKVEIQRHFKTSDWTLKKKGDFGDFEKVDADTVKFSLKLDPKTEKQFEYTLTTRHGTNTD